MNWKFGPLGYVQQQGLAELQNLLDASQAAEQPDLRRVTVLIPPGCRQEMIPHLASAAAITTFHLIREKLTSSPPLELPDLTGEGQIGKLPGGGMLRLRIDAARSSVVATLDILDRQIPGYKQVRQIQFVLPADPTPPSAEHPEIERRVPPPPLALPPTSDQIQVLTEAEFQALAEPALGRIFVSDNPYHSQFFAVDVPARSLIYGYYYLIEPPLIDAVVAAASNLGDKGCYLSMLPRMPELRPEEPYHWYIPFSRISAYKEGDEVFGYASILENVLYSPQGKWGFMMLTDGLGVLGSSSKFMETLRSRLPDLDSQVHSFLEDYQALKASELGRMSDELSVLLKQVYGSNKATKMLQGYGLP